MSESVSSQNLAAFWMPLPAATCLAIFELSHSSRQTEVAVIAFRILSHRCFLSTSWRGIRGRSSNASLGSRAC